MLSEADTTVQGVDAVWHARPPSTLSSYSVKLFAVMLDMSMLLLPGLLIYCGYVGWSPENNAIYLPAAAAMSLITVIGFYLADLYWLRALSNPISFLQRLLPVILIVLLAFVGLLFALKMSDRLSRFWVFSWFIAGSGALVMGRIFLSWFLTSAARVGRIGRNIVIVGGGEQGSRLIGYLQSTHDPLNNIVGVFDDRLERIDPEISGVPLLGNLDDLINYSRKHRCDEILVALPSNAHERVTSVVDKLRVLPVQVGLSSDFSDLNLLSAGYRNFSGVPVLAMTCKPFTGAQTLFKRVQDIVLGSLITLLVLPVMALIAVLVKLESPGPVFFRQPRYGFNNKLINVYKFRTMYAHQSDRAGSQLTRKNDPRITRIGRFLRRSSLDELPQFFNVLKGEMSIVGPRPHAVQAKAGSKLYGDVVGEYASRHRVKPGITGWAQVNGWRGETSTERQITERVNHDLHYIENWSLPLDLWIIVLTVFAVLKADNAT